MAANRVTSTGLEVLTGGGPTKARVTETGLEVLSGGGATKARVTLQALEVLSSIAAGTDGNATGATIVVTISLIAGTTPVDGHATGSTVVVTDSTVSGSASISVSAAGAFLTVNALLISDYRLAVAYDGDSELSISPSIQFFLAVAFDGDTEFTVTASIQVNLTVAFDGDTEFDAAATYAFPRKMFYFAWVNEGETFDPALHNRQDEDIYSFSINQKEGDFATADIVVKNPRVGLLAPGRKKWGYLSWDAAVLPDAPDIQPLYKGRLLGVPDNIFDTYVTLKFQARPSDFVTRKKTLANTMRNLPWWDPLLIAPTAWDDDDTVLEARSELWHIDRVTHTVTSSNVIVPEDGTIEFLVSEAFYDSISVSLQTPPLHNVTVICTIPWDQTDSGVVDLTGTISNAFGVSLGEMIASFTFKGLSDSWPKTGSAIGEGWVVNTGFLEDQSFLSKTEIKIPDYFDQAQIPGPIPAGSIMFQPKISGKNWGGVDGAGFDTNVELVIAAEGWGIPNLTVNYAASRQQSEVVTFTLRTDTQEIATLTDDNESLEIQLSANKASDVTFDGSIPLFDNRGRSYARTARGQQTVQHCLLVARANLIIRSRAVQTSFQTTFRRGWQVSLRKGALVHDNRIPGGTAEGKIVEYTLALDGATGSALATIIIGSAVGRGGAFVAEGGTGVYANNGYVNPGYQAVENQIQLLGTSDITYIMPPFSAFDDGIDFIRGLSPKIVVQECTVDNGADSQRAALIAASPGIGDQAASSAVLQLVPTQVNLKLLSLAGGPFVGEVPVAVSDLIIPKQMDLEATSNG
jgi:hypothetical protein